MNIIIKKRKYADTHHIRTKKKKNIKLHDIKEDRYTV